MSTRALYFGVEATENVLAATRVSIPVRSYGFNNRRANSVANQTTGTRVSAHKRMRGHRFNENSIEAYINYDTVGNLLHAKYGAPTTTASPGGAVGTFQHVFKAGGLVPSFSAQIARPLDSAAEWWQYLGNKLNTFGLNVSSEDQPTIALAGMGRFGTKIATPSALPLTDGAFVQPADIPQQSVTFDGVTWLDLRSLSMDYTDNLERRHTVMEGSDLRRIRRGDAAGSFDLEAEYFGYQLGQTVTVANATDIWTATAHGYTNGTAVTLSNSGGALPTGVTAGTTYYVRDVTANTFTLAATLGGAVVNVTTDGTGTHTVTLAGSADVYRNFDAGSSTYPYIAVRFRDTDTSIGTGTPTNPSLTMLMPKLLVLEGSLTEDQYDTVTAISGDLGYATSEATNLQFTLVNTTASYAAS